jgi:teichuronic acid biosynthesis glycosyltransferase TuaC
MRVLWTHNFNIACPGAGGFMFRFAEGMGRLGVEVELLNIGPFNSLRALKAASNDLALREKSYDLLHAQYGSVCGWLTSKVKAPKLLSLRGSDWYRYFGSNIKESTHSVIANLLTKRAIGQYEHVLVMSNAMAADVIRANLLSDNNKISVLPDPVEMNHFEIKERQSVRRSFFKTDDCSPWVLFVTANKSNPIKRLQLAEDAVEIARRSVQGLQLKVVSNVPYAHMPLYYASSNVVLMTSLYEGWPNTLKEALCCGIPFISTSVSDIKEIALRHGSCKVLDKNISAEILARELVVSLGDHSKHSQAALRSEMNEFDMEVMCRQLTQKYQQVLTSYNLQNRNSEK